LTKVIFCRNILCYPMYKFIERLLGFPIFMPNYVLADAKKLKKGMMSHFNSAETHIEDILPVKEGMPNLDFLLSPSTYYFAEVCRFIIRKLPAWLCYFLANVAGNILYLFWSRARRNIKENVATVLGSDAKPAVVRRIARQCMRNFCKYVVL